MNLQREINLNKRVILIFVLLIIVVLGLSISYAYFEISIIKDNIVVLKTATINVETSIVGLNTDTFTLASGETKTITVNLTTTSTGSIGYKMYYNVLSGVSSFEVTSNETFVNNIVEGNMAASKVITLTFENTGEGNLTIKLGTQGGIADLEIPLTEGIQIELS